ncbi:hypothetical protein [Leptolyngbya sp. NIES-2104]|uniref:hypothetical protein n=1 Tax=Leptolyngbya sp. NIES-2104 TaxID=1552121 RepID=UPI0006ECA5D0|nr:hypothetical protein [Leptolyngbya sp. NIES-2104]GAP95561.1 hypothetical protein NIES2104_20850 [Leptolyngbya sp. NIES-2104]
MFITELSPLVQELAQQPVAFLGGLFTGLLRLSLNEEPVKSWLTQQTGTTVYVTHPQNGNGNTPKSISID